MSKSMLINSNSFSSSELEQAVKEIQSGGVVMIPTDTLYGLAVDPRNLNAIEGLFRVKGRSPSNIKRKARPINNSVKPISVF